MDTSFIAKYFNAEKQESLLFIGAGILSLMIGFVFLTKVSKSFYHGMSYPMFVIALIFINVGLTIFIRSPKDIQRVESYLKELKQSKILSEEIPRMKKVIKSFEMYRWIEFGLMIAGLVIILAHKNPDFWKGFGAGLFMMASIALLFDFFAERRGKVYLERLSEIEFTDGTMNHQK